ncbi:MAG: PAS domain-containing protein [Hymenobacter sp.]|nr:MAG: PAS domain-containing protein [Hymenobacter sp.]
MPDAAAPHSSFPADLRAAYPPDELLWGVLETSLTGLALYAPLRDAAGHLIDFAIDLLNPAAQQLLGQPARPGGTYLAHYPQALANGVFAFYRTVVESGEPGELLADYQVDNLNKTMQLAARRVGQRLLVSFGAAPAAKAAHAEAEAEAERQQFQALADQVPVALGLLAGLELRVVAANQRLCAQWGHAPGQVLHRPLLEAVPELRGQGFEALLHEVMATQKPFVGTEMPARLLRNGQLTTTYYDVVYQPFYTAQGALQGVINVAVEVTAQVLARQRLQAPADELQAANQALTAAVAAVEQARTETERQRRQFEQLFMRAPAAICIFEGPDWVYEFVNPGYQQMFYGRQLLGLPLLEALPEVAGQPLVAILHHVYTTGETFEGREVLVPLARTAGGPIEDIYFDLTYQARYNEQGAIDGFVTYAYDVTEQVLARRQREAQQTQLQEVFEQAPVAIFVLRGPAYIMEVVNPAMSELLGPPIAELLGQPYFEAMPELAGQGYPEILAEVWRTGQPFVAQEQPARLARHQPHETGYFTFVYQPLYDAHGRLTDIMGMAVDITTQVLARQQVQSLNEELAVLNEELQASNEELHDTNTQLLRTNADLDNFIYTASHDLKAPIANIEGLLLALQQEMPAAGRVGQVPTMLLLMQAAIERFGRTIGHLTEVSSLQKAHAQPATPVSLARVIDEVQLDLAPLMLQTDARVLLDVPEGTILLFSEKNLRSVVYNLLSNALKYHHPDRTPVVRVTYWAQGSYQVLAVQDNGLGFDLARGEAKLFAMFQRLHTHVEGTGIGLYMVKKMVENAGGRIEVRSEPEQGATFTVYFPS